MCSPRAKRGAFSPRVSNAPQSDGMDQRSRQRAVRLSQMQAELAVLQSLPKEDVGRYKK